jgi:ribosomal protein L11 methyltransferase
MREVRLRVPAAAAEDVLDRLLPLVPSGAREVSDGGYVELRMRGADLPPVGEIVRAAGGWSHRCSEVTVPDDWRARRVADYVPEAIGGRLVVRPDWAPPARDQPLEIVLTSGPSAFGAGTHPTTRTCLELLLDLPAEGSFADLGTGTGVLAIAAAKLGYEPVKALDISPESIDAAGSNAQANGVRLDTAVSDLATDPPPDVGTIAANIPGWLHERVAAGLDEQLHLALISGFGPRESPHVLAAYEVRGFRARRVLDAHGWVVALLERD